MKHLLLLLIVFLSFGANAQTVNHRDSLEVQHRYDLDVVVYDSLGNAYYRTYITTTPVDTATKPIIRRTTRKKIKAAPQK